MSTALKLRIALVALLALTPVVFLSATGSYHLWQTGWSFYAWCGMAACFLAAYVLAWYWTRKGRLRLSLPPTGPESAPGYWTDRDREAWKLVEAHAAAAATLTESQMSDTDRYYTDARDLAVKIARVYVPNATDPFAHLTVPEILVCGELVAHDLNALVEQYVPGSHLLRLKDWTQAQQFADKATVWYPRFRNAYWAFSAILDPVRTGLQVLGTKAGLAPVFNQVKQNMLVWFHTAYVHKLGRFLIELNSGRLKIGAKRYQELMAEHRESGVRGEGSGVSSCQQEPGIPNLTPDPSPLTPSISVAIVGPVKAGKSSLVNALLGEQLAATDVLPLTPGATKYTLREPGQPTFTLVDTAGYGNEGPTDADLAAALDAAQGADILILATQANSAARKPEVDFLTRLRAGFAALPHLRMPTTVLALTKADQLSPKAEWNPPYDWRDGTRPKEATMRDAVAAAREQFGDTVKVAVPVSAIPGKEFGVRDDLLAVVAELLGDARGVGLLRTLHAEAAADKWKRTGGQLLNAGKALLGALWDSAKKAN